MTMDEIFTSVMQYAKELMEVDRSTLFMVDAQKGIMYTIVADGAPPIVIAIDRGLAGAAVQEKGPINVPDAYQVRRHPTPLTEIPLATPPPSPPPLPLGRMSASTPRWTPRPDTAPSPSCATRSRTRATR